MERTLKISLKFRQPGHVSGSGRSWMSRCVTGLALAALHLAGGKLQAIELPEGYDRIYLTPSAGPSVVAAAEELAGFIEKTFGERPQIRRMPLLGGSGIRIGPAAHDPDFDKDPRTDEFAVRRDRRGLWIAGSDATTTVYAVHRFIEDAFGWYYFTPGPLGLERLDEPPTPPSVSGPAGTLRQEKAHWMSRHPSSLEGTSGGPSWGAWNGLRERFQYNHTLHRIVVPDDFNSHPEWFAKDRSGQPMRPPFAQPHGYNDHPDLSQEGVRQRVVEQTLEALEQTWDNHRTGRQNRASYPPVRLTSGIISVSLSLGDSFVFGNFPEEYPWNPDGYDRRWPDWSNHVFAYTNALADEISRRWSAEPGRPALYLGALSYLVWENVPAFPVHPRIVPYLTFDRSQWYDPQARADDLARVEAWSRAGTDLTGTWDYLFGHGFLIPRSLVTIVSDSIPALHAIGVDAYFSQVGAIWPYDGHTNWLTARLLWNSHADAAALMDLYFQEYFGPAATPMRQFFDQAEQAWMRADGRGWWLRYWKDPWQAYLWEPSQVETLQALLDQAVMAAAVEEQASPTALQSADRFARRVEATRQVFELTRLFVQYQNEQASLQSVSWENAGRALVAKGVTRAAEAVKLRSQLSGAAARVRASNTGAARAADLSWIFRYDTLGASLAALQQAARQAGIAPEEPLQERLKQALTDWAGFHNFSGLPQPGGQEVLFDNAFGHVEDPRIWHHQFMDSEDMDRLIPEAGGYAVESVRRGHLYQLFRAEPGAYYLGRVVVDTRQTPSGEVYIRLDFFDAQHRLIQESARARIVPSGFKDDRQMLRCLMQAPANAAYGRLMIRFFEMDAGSRAHLHSASVENLGVNP